MARPQLSPELRKVPRTIALPPAWDDALCRIALRRGDSLNEVVRQAIALYLRSLSPQNTNSTKSST